MIVSVQIGGRTLNFNAENLLDISIPLDFTGAQPNAYDVEKATAAAYETGGLIGDTRRGGSCNFERISFIPHCNGTHTECVGHLTNARISVRDCLKDVLTIAVLISIEPEKAAKTEDSYASEITAEDLIITRQSIENALAKLKIDSSFLIFNSSLIVRTLPNDKSKLSKTYLDEIPPFFSTEALNFIVESKFKHLLVDLPSIDRLFDEGKLSNHRTFWNVEQGSFELNKESSIHNTITELIYAPDEIKDGAYLLNLQIAPFVSDTAPSRPILFNIVFNQS